MKSKLTPIYAGKCKIQLIPEIEAEKAISNDDVFQAYYQRAISSKFGPRALLMSVDEMQLGFEVTANYVIQSGTIGNI